MLILPAGDVQQCLPMNQAIEAMKSAYVALSAGDAQVPVRSTLFIPPHQGISLIMPAFVDGQQSQALAVKVVSVFPRNSEQGLPIIQAAVLVMEPATGRPVALLEGSSLTAIRTGAASGAATDLLARPESNTVAIFGAGVQGRTQLEAVCTVRKIKAAWIFDTDPDKATSFAHQLAGRGKIPQDLHVATDPNEAAHAADIICTATTSKNPVYPPAAIRPGTHINGVGSFTLEMIENPPEIFSRVRLFVDSREAVMAEAGEVVAAVKQKTISPADLIELGEVLAGQATGRESSEQITFFKSVGVAVQDAAAAQLVLENANRTGIGQKVTW